jgi:hypothetical protein
VDGEDVGEKDGVAGGSLLGVGAVGGGFDFEAEEVGSLALVEDEEDLREETVAWMVSRTTTPSICDLRKDRSVSVITARGGGVGRGS